MQEDERKIATVKARRFRSKTYQMDENDKIEFVWLYLISLLITLLAHYFILRLVFPDDVDLYFLKTFWVDFIVALVVSLFERFEERFEERIKQHLLIDYIIMYASFLGVALLTHFLIMLSLGELQLFYAFWWLDLIVALIILVVINIPFFFEF